MEGKFFLEKIKVWSKLVTSVITCTWIVSKVNEKWGKTTKLKTCFYNFFNVFINRYCKISKA